MSNWLSLALAAFGVSYIVRYTDGPYEIFRSLRKSVGIIYVPVYDAYLEAEGEVEEVDESSQLAKVVDCFWCLTTWVSLALTLLLNQDRKMTLAEFVVCWLSATGFSGMLHKFLDDC